MIEYDHYFVTAKYIRRLYAILIKELLKLAVISSNKELEVETHLPVFLHQI